MRLDDRTLRALARGCGLLGAGGGGDTFVPLTMARRAVAEHGPVDVVTADDLTPDGLVMPCGLLGSPAVAAERIPGGDEGHDLRAAVEARFGVPVVALMPYSIGGVNALVCAAWAARLGLPLLDADAMGRTFPSLAQMATGLGGVRATPAVLTDGRGNTVVLDAADDACAERLARRIATSMSGVCAIAVACLTVRDARRCAILGSISGAVARGADPDGLGRVLAEGHVGEIERRVAGDTIHVSALLDPGGRRIWLEAQSELLLALEDGAVRAAVPDVLALVDAASGAPLLVERLHDDQAVRLLVLEAAPVWRTPGGRALTEPAAFALELPDIPNGEVRDASG
ncbi:DUF917 domain-containing protein [Conexibacter woesei]|uniref:DUF917 domain-containing protein n=1 Tax=Conexibacter woesei TaxID=191495 RepID=UPI000683F6B7|nr:DUF917 domain-containing protein [Conexibacter woesei]